MEPESTQAAQPQAAAPAPAPEPEVPKHPLYPAADPAHEGMALSEASKQKLATLAGTLVSEAPQNVVEMFKHHQVLVSRVQELAQIVEEISSVIGKISK